ncbi:response regulator [Saccharopolyspora phatthalungensis]|uniref:Two-component system KDP operon response regulator KdpE n=1 Tax=Saccharopolyspora phatthalungensis TaxID=664693 RepID=A0A840Q7M0_9PSEU|nr:response regulator [Saccharopolyspora phatthalungensis]MBB5156446.1 two-component system KDP operon response regulator KdpE [Saccharopolyspora phatthalungensis]
MTRVLVVDDDHQILRALRINLRARHYDVAVAADGIAALRCAADWHPDLVVLDLGLPDLEGIEVIQGLRGWSAVPIIVLSGRSDSRDKVDALDAGADDYLTKPFGLDELLARIRAVSRRTTTGDAAATVPLGDYLVDLTDKTVHRAGDTDGPHLTRTEWELLQILLRNPGKLISQQHLLTQVWGPTYVRNTHYLRQYMAQLRRKLEANPDHPRHLLTETGMGYRFQP